MRRTLRQSIQQDLFHLPQVKPDWQELPEATRQKAVTLLAQLLQTHPLPIRDTRTADQEGHDE